MSSKQVRQAILTAPGKIAIVRRERPALGRDDIRIRVEQCGVSRSDVEHWAGQTDKRLPVELGQELAGRVIEVTPSVQDIAVGDRVAAWAPSGGGMADEAVVEADYCFKVSDDVAYPFAAKSIGVLRTIDANAGVRDAHTVIVGAGSLGMLALMLPRDQARHPRSVIVSSRRREALDLARRHGATHVAEPGELERVVRRATNGHGADVAYEFTGAQAGLDQATSVVRPGGTLVIGGLHQTLAGPRSRMRLRAGQRVVDLERLNSMAVRIVNAHTRDPRLIQLAAERACELLDQRSIDAAAIRPWMSGADSVVELLASTVATVTKAGFNDGDHTVVIGSDPRALLAIMLLRAQCNPRSVILATRQLEVRELGRSLGATHVVHPDELGAAVAQVTNGEGADVVYEFAGTQAGLDLATRAVGVSGKLVIAGSHSGPATPDGTWELKPGQRLLDLARLQRMGVDLFNGHFRRREAIMAGMEDAVWLLNRNPIVNPAALIRGTFELDEIAAAFAAAARTMTKVVVKP